MKNLGRLFGALLCLTALFAFPIHVNAAETVVSVEVADEETLLTVLDAAAVQPEMPVRINLKGQVELSARIEIPMNVQLIIDEETVLTIVTENGKLTNDGSILINGGAIQIGEKGRLLNRGSMQLTKSSLAVEGKLWCYENSILEADTASKIDIGEAGEMEIREDAEMDVKSPIENAGTIEAEDAWQAKADFLVNNAESGTCEGLSLSYQAGYSQIRNMEDLQQLLTVAMEYPKRSYLATVVRSLRLREELCLPANMSIVLESDLEIRSGGALIAYGELLLRSGNLQVNEGGEFLALGDIVEKEGEIILQDRALLMDLAGLKVLPPETAQYDVFADDQWNTAGGVVVPLLAGGRELPETPLTASMLPDFASIDKTLGVQGISVSCGGCTLENAFGIEFIESLSLAQAAEKGLSIDGENLPAETILVVRAVDEKKAKLLTEAVEKVEEEVKACTLACVELRNDEDALSRNDAITLRFYPKDEVENTKWLFFALAEDGSVQMQEARWNGRSLSVAVNDLGCFAICSVTACQQEDAAEALEPTPLPTPTSMPTPAGETNDGKSELVPQTTVIELRGTAEPSSLSEEGEALPEELVHALGLGVGAVFLLLIAAAAVIALRSGSGKQ